MFYEVIPTKIFREDAGSLTYSSPVPLQPGQIVRIPLGRTETNGIVLKKVPSVDFPTKPIIRPLYDTPLPSHLLKATSWLSKYYLAPLPNVASLILPVGVEKTRRPLKSSSAQPPSTLLQSSPSHPSSAPLQSVKIPLNPAQRQALSRLSASPSFTTLLHGITGSGKTNIYLKLAETVLLNNQSVIVLVPEISLTSQLVQIFCSTFHQSVSLIHSQQTESERHQIWQKLLLSKQPEIIIGPRSALFAPVHNLGLIIIDEAHEPAYFQENSPKYSALRLASFIATTLKIHCVLGTATPLVSDYHLALSNQALVPLNTPAKNTARPPVVKIINLSDHANFQKNRYFSDPLLSSITSNLSHHHQTLIFHNRRGSAPLTICEKCGWEALCPHCFLPLTLHTDNFNLICHTCNFSMPLPHSCPDCHCPNIVHKGFGTKLLESELGKLFPQARVIRFDADNHKKDSLTNLYDKIKDGDFDIIIGTQTIARGLDLPHLASVGVVQADAGLSLPDFATEERTFHLLTQVIGRVGRGHLDTAEVFIQTFRPDHPVITSAIHGDYDAFQKYLLKKRQKEHLPPFCYLARLSIISKTEPTAIKKITAVHQYLAHSPVKVLLSPPTPAFHEQSSSGFQWQIILRSPSRRAIVAAIQNIPPKLKKDLHLILDPPSLL